MMFLLAIGTLLSILSAGMFVSNVRRFRRLPQNKSVGPGLSVLIPARNEEKRIGAALRSLLSCRGVDIEIIVLDDGSSDRTASIVGELSNIDSRIRLETSQPVGDGWCGKTFACHQLAKLARHQLLLFLDADVQVTDPDALARLVDFMEKSNLALISGFPRQETGTLAEKLIVPLIQFVLLGFLPIGRMRTTTAPAFGAACGQLVAVRRAAYEEVGGHRAILTSLHDGLMLARHFRTRGFRTDIFDASDCFRCRMYESMWEVWNGFLKNSHEGLGAPRLIAWATFLLLGGQVLPWWLLITNSGSSIQWLIWLAVFASLLPRLIGVTKFGESLLGAILHPLGVSLLLLIQWSGLICSFAKRPVQWKGRSYLAGATA